MGNLEKVLKVRKKKTKIKEKENNVFKQGRDVFRVALRILLVWHSMQDGMNQRLPGALEMSQDLVIKH